MIIRYVIGLVFAVFIILRRMLRFGKHIRHRALPEYEGQENVTGILHPVEIYRDSFAIAHIYANSDDEAYYALGYAHAQERLFQMDFTRRIGCGLLSEVLGEKALLIDKWARIIGFSRIGQW